MNKENATLKEMKKYINDIKTFMDFFISIGVVSDIVLILNKIINVQNQNYNTNQEALIFSSIALTSLLASIITNNAYKDALKDLNEYNPDATNIIERIRIKNM